MKPDVSIIAPYHNEGMSFIVEAINQIRDTIDISYEIIVVDDGSKFTLQPIEGVKVIRHPINLGVGVAFDTGVKAALSDNLFLMGSDIRFIDNKWGSLMLKEIEMHPKAITASECVGLNNESPEGMDLKTRRNRSRRYGSTVIMFHDHKTHPKKPDNFRNIIECQWLPVAPPTMTESYPIPCVLGAFYGISKEWYNYIGGFELHRSWGTLEPMIGLKSWFMGGENRVAPHVSTGHIFKRHGTHNIQNSHLIYNKILVATLLFNDFDSERLINFLGSNPQVHQGKKMFNEHKKAIMAKRKEYAKKIVLDAATYCKRWGIDFRN